MILIHNNSEVLKNEYQELFFFSPKTLWSMASYLQLMPAITSFCVGKKKKKYIYIYIYVYICIYMYIYQDISMSVRLHFVYGHFLQEWQLWVVVLRPCGHRFLNICYMTLQKMFASLCLKQFILLTFLFLHRNDKMYMHKI